MRTGMRKTGAPEAAPPPRLRPGAIAAGLGAGFERALAVSFQPDAAKAARQLAGALVRALGKVKDRRGVLVAQLDELVCGSELLVAGVPFLPSEPVALCLTGSPALVAAVRAAMGRASSARFAWLRPARHVGVLRVGAAACDGAIVLDTSRELAGAAAERLAGAGWVVTATDGDDERAWALWEASGVVTAQ